MRDNGSVFRLVKQLGYITKEPFVICVGNQRREFFPPKRVMISEKFFRSAKCKMCGMCCEKIKGVSLFFTKSDISHILNYALSELNHKERELREILMRGLIPISVHINTTKGSKHFGCYMYYNEDRVCDFADMSKGLCGIHKIKPVHCALPMMEIDRTKDSARLIKRPRGRNWRFGCPVEFGPFSFSEFKNWDLPYLERLLVNASDFDLDTWLTEIVDYLRSDIQRLERLDNSDKVLGHLICKEIEEGQPRIW